VVTTLTGRELTDPERRLRDEAAAGRRLDLRVGTPAVDDPMQGASWGLDRTIRARVLYDMLTEGVQAGGQPRALSLVGARIVEAVDLEGAVTDWRVVFEGCSFAEPMVLARATVLMVVLARCHLPALDAQQANIQGNFLLKSGLVSDGVCLAGAHIGGVLDLNGTTLIGRDGPALQGDMVTVGQNMTCLDGFTAQGALHLPGARIGGQLNLTGARFSNPDLLALGADRLAVEHDMICREVATQGEVRLVGAHIGGQLDLEGANLDNPDGLALRADQLAVSQSVYCRGGFHAQGEVRLVGAHIGGQLDLEGAKLDNPGRRALMASGLTIDRDMFCRRGFTATGELRLGRAHIRGQLDLADGHLSNLEGSALTADGLTVDQDMSFSPGFTAEGEVLLIGARVGAQLRLAGARMTNPSGAALIADRLRVDQDMFCGDGFTAQGDVRLVGADISGQLDLEGAVFDQTSGCVLHLDAVRASDLRLCFASPPSRVTLTHAHVGVLVDAPDHWPPALGLVGFAYDALHEKPTVPVRKRLEWLCRDPAGYSPYPYEQLAAVYRQAGREEDARQVAIARQRRRWRTRSWPARLWGLLLRALVGYGYRPGVDQVDGQHRVRPGGDAVRVAGREVDLDPLEAIAQLTAKRGEPLAGAAPVGGEAQPEHAQPLPCPRLDRRRSASSRPTAARLRAPRGAGSAGWLTTGASTDASMAMASANPPVKHMPIAPTPGPRL
jgi:hypothetical protein